KVVTRVNHGSRVDNRIFVGDLGGTQHLAGIKSSALAEPTAIFTSDPLSRSCLRTHPVVNSKLTDLLRAIAKRSTVWVSFMIKPNGRLVLVSSKIGRAHV